MRCGAGMAAPRVPSSCGSHGGWVRTLTGTATHAWGPIYISKLPENHKELVIFGQRLVPRLSEAVGVAAWPWSIPQRYAQPRTNGAAGIYTGVWALARYRAHG